MTAPAHGGNQTARTRYSIITLLVLSVFLDANPVLTAEEPPDSLQRILDESRYFSEETLKSIKDSARKKVAKGKVAVLFEDLPGYPIPVTRAVSILPHPPEVIWQVLLDYDNYKEFMPFTKASMVDPGRSAGEVLFFRTELALPVVSDRYYTLIFNLEEYVLGKPGTFFLRWALDPESESNFNLNSGSWKLAPYGPEEQQTLVFLTVANDPGGSIPDFIKKKSSATAIVSNFEAISERAGQGLTAGIYYRSIPENKLDRYIQKEVDESRTFDYSYLEELSARRKKELKEGEILVTMSDIKGTWVKAAQAVALLKAPSSRVLEVITEYEQYQDYMPYVSSIEVDKERSKGNVRYVAYRLHFLLLPYIKDRYFTIKMIKEDLSDTHPPGTFFLTWRLDPTMPTNFKRNAGSWKLVPCGKGGSHTLVFHTVFANPGGLSPWFWRNISEKRVVQDVIYSIKERAEE